jgi:hypothetical protein
MATPAGPVPRSLSVDDCHALLAAGRIGHVVFETADGLASQAVSYAMAGRVVLLCTGADTELAARTSRPPWPDGGREVYLQITPYRITGQRVCG